MFGVREFNIAVELWGVAFCIICIGCVFLFARMRGRYRTVFLVGFAAELVAAGGDAFAGMFRGQEGALAWAAVHIGNYAGFIANFIVIAVLTTYVCMRIEDAGGPAYDRWQTIVYAVTFAMCVLVLLSVFFYVDEDNLYHRSDWFWLSLAYAVVVEVVNAALAVRNRRKIGFAALTGILFYTLAPAVAAIFQVFVYGLNFIFMASLLGLVVVFFEMQQNMARIFEERTAELARSKVEVSESRIAVMVSQIQPHFLFNTLDTIYGLVDEDTEKAKEAIASFSRYLRGNLDSLKHVTPVPIEREMEHVRTYLELERMSDEGRLDYEFDIQATGFLVPALAVQTLVENAVKHGLGERENGGSVIVRTREQATEHTVAVIDDGVGFDVESLADAQGVGVANTRARLASMCGGSLDVHSEPNVGTTVVLHVPKDPGGSDL